MPPKRVGKGRSTRKGKVAANEGVDEETVQRVVTFKELSKENQERIRKLAAKIAALRSRPDPIQEGQERAKHFIENYPRDLAELKMPLREVQEVWESEIDAIQQLADWQRATFAAPCTARHTSQHSNAPSTSQPSFSEPSPASSPTQPPASSVPTSPQPPSQPLSTSNSPLQPHDMNTFPSQPSRITSPKLNPSTSSQPDNSKPTSQPDSVVIDLVSPESPKSPQARKSRRTRTRKQAPPEDGPAPEEEPAAVTRPTRGRRKAAAA